MQRTTKLAAAVASAIVVVGGVALAVNVAGAGSNKLTVELNDPAGTKRGVVEFRDAGDDTQVYVRIDSSADGVALDAFHGFHVHANNDPANGEGCVADPDQPSNTWFTAVDGHWKDEGQVHAHHLGDMPSLRVTDRGTAEMRFTTSRMELGDLHGKAVIMHAGPDNFGNIPTGTAPNQYQPNSDEAVTATNNTGNAGDRVLCGVIG